MKKYWGKIGLLGIFLLMVSVTFAQKIEIRRLNGGEPIVSLASFRQAGYPEKEGENINGPCLIRLPDWLPALFKICETDGNEEGQSMFFPQ